MINLASSAFDLLHNLSQNQIREFVAQRGVIRNVLDGGGFGNC